MISIRFLLTAAMAVGACLSTVSCANWQEKRQLANYQSYDLPAFKPSDRSQVKVKVSLNRQRVYVMEGSKMLLAMPVSVGTKSTPTPRGSFKIFRKNHHHRANSHGFAKSGNRAHRSYLRDVKPGWSFKGTPMPYWCEFKPHYGFHAGWVKHQPCTHGCIRMHENLAPKFFELVSEGTPVHIANTQPEDATHGNLPLPPDAGPLPDYPFSMYLSDGYFSQHKNPTYVGE